MMDLMFNIMKSDEGGDKLEQYIELQRVNQWMNAGYLWGPRDLGWQWNNYQNQVQDAQDQDEPELYDGDYDGWGK